MSVSRDLLEVAKSVSKHQRPDHLFHPKTIVERSGEIPVAVVLLAEPVEMGLCIYVPKDRNKVFFQSWVLVKITQLVEYVIE